LTSDLEARLIRYRPDQLLDVHCHDRAGISVVVGGEIKEESGGREAVGRIGSIVLKPAGLAHRNRVGPAGAVLVAIRGVASEAAAASWRWLDRPGAAAASLAIVRELRAGDADGEAQEALIGLVASIADNPADRAEDQDGLLRDVRERIEDDPQTPRVTTLARELGLHPASLSRAFRRRYGCPVSVYARRARMRRAAALLLSADMKVSEVAASLDYFDQSHLCRAFKTELGMAPNDYRRLMRG
jgi:AraC-like DNA-binding protein